MATFLLLYAPGPAWVLGKPTAEQPPHEHGPYVLRLYASGKVRFAGPFTDNAGAALVLDVTSADEAHAIAPGDPAVQAQVFVYTCHPWHLIPWEHYLHAGTLTQP